MEIKKVVFENETEKTIFCRVTSVVSKKVYKGWLRWDDVKEDMTEIYVCEKYWSEYSGCGIAYNCRTSEKIIGELTKLMDLAYTLKGEVNVC